MDARLQEMLDHHEIRKTLSQYCHGCDRCDAPTMGGVYMQDSWDDHGIRQAPGAEFTQAMIDEVLETTESLYHLLGQSTIRVDGDEAGAETYFLAAMVSIREDGVTMCNQLGGRFVDALRRDGERWRIERRVVVRDWGVSLPVEQDWTADAGLKPGQRSAADPAFAVLRRAHGGFTLAG